MLYLIKFIYTAFLLPPGMIIAFLLILGGWLIYKRRRSIAFVLLGITALLYFSANTFCSNLLIHSLEYRYRPPQRISGDVIVMLGGGATLDSPNLSFPGHFSGAAANRLLTCIQLYHRLKVPVLISGGKVFSNTGREAAIGKLILTSVGISAKQVIVEDRSLNTTQNAAYTKILIDKFHFKHPILVTSAFHMPRAVKQFQKVGVKVKPCPTDYRTNFQLRFTASYLIPSADAINDFSIAVKEYIGLLFVKLY